MYTHIFIIYACDVKCMYQIHIYRSLNTDIFITIHTGAAAQRVPIPNHIFLRLCSQLQSSTRVLRNMKIPPSFDFTFHWENEQQY